MIPTMVANVEQWLRPAPRLGQRKHFNIDGLHAYLRVSMRMIDGQMGLTLDLADVDFTPELRGRGLFSMLLTELERVAHARQLRLVAESVVNEIVFLALRRRGYREIDTRTYVNPLPKEKA